MCSVVCSYGGYNFFNSTMIVRKFSVSDVGFFIVMIDCAFVSLLSIYSEAYYISGLTLNVYVPSYFNDVK